jgi:hypothetical protein
VDEVRKGACERGKGDSPSAVRSVGSSGRWRQRLNSEERSARIVYSRLAEAARQRTGNVCDALAKGLRRASRCVFRHAKRELRIRTVAKIFDRCAVHVRASRLLARFCGDAAC